MLLGHLSEVTFWINFRDIFFTFVTGDNGDVKYMIGGDEQNKDLIRLSMKEFFNYAASIGAFGNMIEP